MLERGLLVEEVLFDIRDLAARELIIDGQQLIQAADSGTKPSCTEYMRRIQTKHAKGAKMHSQPTTHTEIRPHVGPL